MSTVFNKKAVLVAKKVLSGLAPDIELIALDSAAGTAKEAADSLGVNVGSIVKSIIVKDDTGLFYLCLCSGDKQLQLKKVSRILGNRVIKATAEEVKSQTGFSIGGVCPVGHLNTPAQVFLDMHLDRFDTLYAAGGHPFVVFEITYQRLLRLTNSKPKDISA